MTPQEFLAKASQQIESKQLHVSESRQHAEQIVLRTLQWTPTELLLKKDEPLTPKQHQLLETVLSKRLLREPLQYILGFEYFYEACFSVGPGCLIPRKETELLVDEIISFHPETPLKIAELGAGTGNIGLSVLLKRPEVEWHAFEINPLSLPYLNKNKTDLLKKAQKYVIHSEDFFQESPKWAPYDIIVSNPPYLSDTEMNSLPAEVRHEPELALRGGGAEGLGCILRLLETLPGLLKTGGLFLCEIGTHQEEALQKELSLQKKGSWKILRDLSKLPRVLQYRLLKT